MAQPVTGIDAIIQFQKSGEYYPYACAESIELGFDLETVSVKTIGDGVWSKPRGQKLSYQISLNGVIKYDDDTQPHSFDLLDYLLGMTAIPYRIIFTNDEGGLKVIEGVVLPINVNMGGGSEGFASGSATLKGDGAVEVRNLIIPCPSSVTSVQLVQDGTSALIRVTGHTGSPERYDYSVDGGGLQTEFVDSFIEDLPLQDGLAPGEHTITITPVCENGYNGTPFTTTFEILATGGGGGSCDVPVDLDAFTIDEYSGSASWSAPVSPPADGYYWELYMGATFIDSGTTALTNVTFTGLAADTEYNVKVKSVCETGVSESAFVETPFITAEADPLTFTWNFTKDAAFGSLKITKNGLLILNQTSTGSGSLSIEAGATVVVFVQEVGDAVKSLFIEDTTTPAVLYNEADSSDKEHEFVVEALKSYEVLASITD